MQNNLLIEEQTPTIVKKESLVELSSERSDPMESQLIKSLRYCKGITSNSMLSFVLPKFSSIGDVCKELEHNYKRVKNDCDDLLAYGQDDTEDEKKYDIDRADYMYACKVFEEASDFIKKIRYQDYDKDIMGIIIYYGYIDDGQGLYKAKKAFHTFPCPIDMLGENTFDKSFKICQRFDLSILNSNEWFLDEFDKII